MDEMDILYVNVALYTTNILLIIGIVFLHLYDLTIPWKNFLLFIYSFIIFLMCINLIMKQKKLEIAVFNFNSLTKTNKK